MLLIVVLVTVPLVVKAGCLTNVKEVSIRADGCITTSTQVWQHFCTEENSDYTNGTSNNTAEVPCQESNYTKIKQMLFCHDGYELHERRVLSYSLTRNNCTDIAGERESPEILESPTKSAWPLGMYKVVQPVIVVIGLTGNLLSLLVMSSKILRQFSFSVYLQILAVVDSLVLLHYGLTYLGIVHNTNDSFTFFMKGYAACMAYPYLVRVAQLSSVWCVVGFTVDRAIAVCKPFMACQYLTISRSRKIAGGIVFVIMLSQMYHLILLDKKTKFCLDPFSFPADASRLGAVAVLVLISKGTLLMFLPCIIVLVCNVKVISAVKRRRTVVERSLDSSSNSANSKKSQRSGDTERRMSLKLLSVSITFLLLSLPEAVLSFIDFTNILSGVDRWYLKHKNFRFMARMIFSLNFAINYFLYGIVFRKQALLCSSCRKSQ